MLKKLTVPTRQHKDFLKKYFDKNSTYTVPIKQRKRHNPYFSNILCRYFASNSCTKGEDCIFSHNPSNFPCVNDSTCDKVNCDFKHESSTDQPNNSSESDKKSRLFSASPLD